ncbi:MAG TPA: sialidase family protein [Woeseiaceae bacterium]|nr:sialidase family protein [Woeseiaceae bacterium]
MVDITDVGPTPVNFVSGDPKRGGSGRVLCIAVAADGRRLYAGSYAGVWRSDDGGSNWRQMTRPQPGTFDAEAAGALFAPYVVDLAVSPGDANLVISVAEASLFSPNRDGIYRSTDGGATWTLVHLLIGSQRVSQVAFAPDDPNLVMAALGPSVAVSTDAGATWTLRSMGGNAWHIAIGPLERGSGVRRAYAAGDNRIWRSVDGGTTWEADLGANLIIQVRDALEALVKTVIPDYDLPSFAPRTGHSFALVQGQALAIAPDNPLHVYLVTRGGAHGPTFFHRPNGAPHVPDGTTCNFPVDVDGVRTIRGAGEASLWFGDYTNFDVAQSARWEAVPGPPVYWGGSTPSGQTHVSTQPTPSGRHLVFFADNSHVHMSAGRPTRTSAWYRLDGRGVATCRRMSALSNHLHVHVDPYGTVVASPDFDVTLKVPTDVPSPYNDTSELDAHLGGVVWLANDGGVWRSEDGGQTWIPAQGLHTVDAINIAGVAKPDKGPALYIGTADNDSFFTRDGGASWRDCWVHLGDADAWFADGAQPGRVIQFTPRDTGLCIWSGDFPNAEDSGSARKLPTPNFAPAGMGPHNAVSTFVLRGTRPLVLTLATEAPEPDGDFILVMVRPDGSFVLKRTRKMSSIVSADDWENPEIVEQIGPDLPPGAAIAQAAGGHANPVFYVSDNNRLWKLDAASQTWRQIVPGGPPGWTATAARRFFVDPFNPDLVYILDTDRFRVSVDGGASWMEDVFLTRAMTGDGRLVTSQNDILTDMQFLRSDRLHRFALGAAGVMRTSDGVDWRVVYNAIALPGLPESAYYDGISNPLQPKLYVVVEGRGVLRLDLPPPSPFEPGGALLDILPILHEA